MGGLMSMVSSHTYFLNVSGTHAELSELIVTGFQVHVVQAVYQ
jgi:hypothetical protein